MREDTVDAGESNREERLVAATSEGVTETTPPDGSGDPVAKKHRAAIRRGAEQGDDE